METTTNKSGFLCDMNILRGKVEKNVRLAANTLRTLRLAAESGELAGIPPAELVRLLAEAESALSHVTN